MTTVARPIQHDSAHWYDPATGEPCYEIMGKTTGRPRPVNLGDARKLGYVPSVTTILGSVLRKPQLEDWKTEQAVLAALTTPRNEGEELDAFVKRVMSQDAQAESQRARDLGTQVHDAIECASTGLEWDKSLSQYVWPVLEVMAGFGRVVAAERIVFGPGYAGRMDLLMEGGATYVFDFKTCKKLPTKESWTEHQLQTSALAHAYGLENPDRSNVIITGNIYVSTTEPGKLATFMQTDWRRTYAFGFARLLDYWQWQNDLIQII